MNNTISTEKALQQGQKMITIPSMVAMFSLMIIFCILGENEVIPKQFVLLGILFAIFSSWIVWSVQVPKWKIWAYKNVDNIAELKMKAVESKLIWNDSHIFTRTEIWNKKQKLAIQNMKDKR